jgi:hypothetical protein
MKVLLFSLVLLFSCAHINGAVFAGGSFGRNKQECINKGGTCYGVGCNDCVMVSEEDIMYAGGSFGKAESDCRKKGGEYLGGHACSLDYGLQLL